MSTTTDRQAASQGPTAQEPTAQEPTAQELWDGILDMDHRADPYPLFAQLRRDPVTRLDDGTHLVTGYPEILELLYDPRISSDPRNRADGGLPGHGGHAESGTGADEAPEATPEDAPDDAPDDAPEDTAPRCPVDHGASRTEPVQDAPAHDDETPSLTSAFVMLDPPHHDRLRRQTMRHFGPPGKPGYVDSLRADMTTMVDDLIDRFAARHGDGPGEVDVVEEFAYPFPVAVICEVLGVPPADEPRFHAWSEAIIATPEAVDAQDAAVKQREAAEANAALTEYLAGLIEAKRADPRDDLLSGLVHDDGPEGCMRRVDMLNTSIMLLIGGHETTVNMIANGVLTLLRHPDVLDRLTAEPAYVARVFEELLRYEPPAQVTPTRVTLTEVTVGGVTIPAGAPVSMVWAAANRDPRHFADPERFDPDRPGNDHVGFGGGIHACFGAPLARLETQIALGEFFRRVENPRLVVDPPPYRRNPLLRGPQHLRVAYDGVRPR